MVDPALNVRDTKHQIDDIIDTLNGVIRGGKKALITTITKAMSEEMSRYLSNVGIQNAYLHSDIDTLDRVKILDDLREDRIDVIVGVNLLREGIDLPDVSLAVILDADKQGFLRDVRSITQISGRAARNEQGLAILYGTTVTDTMRVALTESNRRRSKQVMFNFENNNFPHSARRSGPNQSHLTTTTEEVETTQYNNIEYNREGIVAEEYIAYSTNGTTTIEKSIEQLIEEARTEMEKAAKNLDFIAAAKHRDRMYELQRLREQDKLGGMYERVRKAK